MMASFLSTHLRKNPICNADGIFSVKFVPYGTSEIRRRVWNCLRQWNTPAACGGTNFISHLAEQSEARYFTISEGNDFTFDVRRIFHFVFLDTPSVLCYTGSEKAALLCSKILSVLKTVLSISTLVSCSYGSNEEQVGMDIVWYAETGGGWYTSLRYDWDAKGSQPLAFRP